MKSVTIVQETPELQLKRVARFFMTHSIYRLLKPPLLEKHCQTVE